MDGAFLLDFGEPPRGFGPCAARHRWTALSTRPARPAVRQAARARRRALILRREFGKLRPAPRCGRRCSRACAASSAARPASRAGRRSRAALGGRQDPPFRRFDLCCKDRPHLRLARPVVRRAVPWRPRPDRAAAAPAARPRSRPPAHVPAPPARSGAHPVPRALPCSSASAAGGGSRKGGSAASSSAKRFAGFQLRRFCRAFARAMNPSHRRSCPVRVTAIRPEPARGHHRFPRNAPARGGRAAPRDSRTTCASRLSATGSGAVAPVQKRPSCVAEGGAQRRLAIAPQNSGERAFITRRDLDSVRARWPDPAVRARVWGGLRGHGQALCVRARSRSIRPLRRKASPIASSRKACNRSLRA